jgi:hypothetical protein
LVPISIAAQRISLPSFLHPYLDNNKHFFLRSALLVYAV